MNFDLDSNVSVQMQILNRSGDVDPALVEKFIHNRAIDQPAYDILIFFYAILIIMGAFGNMLVILSVIRRPTMQTPRNMFIVNLAISDLLLCTVTMPLTLMEILAKYWPLGEHAFICKMIGPLQATSIFVSTISITAIALDRYQVIMYPTKVSLQISGATLIICIIWMTAAIFASPLFFFKSLVHINITLNGTGLDGVDYCFEDWSTVGTGRTVYSVFSLIIQYIIPILIVSVAYLRIYYKLRCRFAAGFISSASTATQSNSSASHQSNDRKEIRGRRLHRTNLLLMSIAVIFFISWLPLNIFNLVADMCEGSCIDYTTESMVVAYAICHMMGMSSACSNPVLYGWLNENFFKEFRDMMCSTVSQPAEKRNSQLLHRNPSPKSNKAIVLNQEMVTEFNANTTTLNTEMSQVSKS